MQALGKLFGRKELGVVRMFDRDKGFGFISRMNRQADAFLHASELRKMDRADLVAGECVAFDVVDHPKGPRAVNVVLAS